MHFYAFKRDNKCSCASAAEHMVHKIRRVPKVLLSKYPCLWLHTCMVLVTILPKKPLLRLHVSLVIVITPPPMQNTTLFRHRHRIAAQVQLLELEQHFLVAHAATLAAQQHATQQQADAEGDKVRGPTSTHQQQLTQPPQLDEQNDGRQAEVVKRARSPALEGAVCAEVGGDALHPEKRMRSGGHVTLQQQQQQLESAPQEVRRTSIPQNHELAIPSNCQPQQQQQQQQQSSQQPQSSQHTAAAPQKEAKRTSTAKNQELARHNRERQALVQQQGKEKKAMQRQHVQELRVGLGHAQAAHNSILDRLRRGKVFMQKQQHKA
eukprot:scaffold60368_cov26-Tisochrysis_lutea.AAC.1